MDRFEILEIGTERTTVIKIDKYTGLTHSFSGKIDDPWNPIRNDDIPANRATGDKINFQIFSSPSNTILYHIHDGRTWFLLHGPLGYNLYWKKAP